MKVLLVNGSPHEKGCVYTALTEIADTLKSAGLDSEIFWIGNRPVQGCIGCWQCREKGTCAFQDELYTGFIEKMKNSDGIIIGSPVYYAGPNGSLCALLDRVFFSGSEFLRRKPGACVVNCSRGGASAAFDRLNKYFTILQMPVVSSQYWNSTHGTTPEEVKEDEEGLQTMRTLARNMAYLLKSNAVSGIGLPPSEPLLRTNFIR
jgi:multimeric flavodoxin WrbA